MKRLILTLTVMAVAAVSCQKDVVLNDTTKEKESVVLSATRSYDEALKIAEDALSLLEGENTRSAKRRVIKRTEGQTVMRPVTRGSETTEEPIMYVFNNENDEGFTIVAANRSIDPVIAVTEEGNYTYGEPTGVEPFDLLMEDVATTLVLFPDEPLAIKYVKENEVHKPYGPFCSTQWGTGTIYGAMYPDGKAYDEAAAIAQIVTRCLEDSWYTITNPSDPLYGQNIALNVSDMGKHKRYDHMNMAITQCTEDIHQQISRLYYEIGYRLSNGTVISLANKLTPFPLARVKSVLAGFDISSSAIENFSAGVVLPSQITIGGEPSFCSDLFMFKGVADQNLPDNSSAHTWFASGFDHVTYDYVEYTLNRILDPTHPNPTDYTETDREEREYFMLHINWGFDGISNGWFHSGCFDMSQRIESGLVIGGNTAEYDYNFSNIQYFRIPLPTYPEKFE